TRNSQLAATRDAARFSVAFGEDEQARFSVAFGEDGRTDARTHGRTFWPVVPLSLEDGLADILWLHNLSEVIFLGGKRLLNQGLFDCGFRQRDEQGLLNHEALDEMLLDDDGVFAFLSCPLTTVKISISWAVSEAHPHLRTKPKSLGTWASGGRRGLGGSWTKALCREKGWRTFKLSAVEQPGTTRLMGDQLQRAASQPEVFLLYEGGEVTEDLRRSLTHVRVGPQVKEIPNGAFRGCDTLIDLQLNEGLQVIGARAFHGCTSLIKLQFNEGVTKLGRFAFAECSSLIELHLKEGLQVIGGGAFYGCKALRSVTLPSGVTDLEATFCGCTNLAEVCLNEGLRIIGDYTFKLCTVLRSVTIPSNVVELGNEAFSNCGNMFNVRLNEGLQIIGTGAFFDCTALRTVALPSTVTELGTYAFHSCSNLSEVILLSGERLLNQEFVDCGFHRGVLLDQGAMKEMLFVEGRHFAFDGCPLTTVKISIPWAVTERMERLPQDCMLPIEERIHSLRLLEQLQDGEILACFPVVRTAAGAQEGTYEVKDTSHETASSLFQVLKVIAFHELKESSILIDLAMWKSRINGKRVESRADCRVSIPDPAKSLIMEYCGFACFLEPSIEGT
ncbi:hypothetical protein THAOC_22870, partial [Thalassiosira oceanica]